LISLPLTAEAPHMFARASCAALLLVCAATLAAAFDFKIACCPHDLVNCKKRCHSVGAASDTCVVLPKKKNPGITWDCALSYVGSCFELIAYPAGSKCAGGRNSTAVGSRANFCDECKGAGANNHQLLPQKRVCRTVPGTSTIYQVDYLDCQAINQTASKAVCEQCAPAPAVSFPLGQCVEYQGNDWRLEVVSDACELMPHKHFPNDNCTGPAVWQDHIVLDRCNEGYQFSCPKV
jgi:hypothetical protein